ncbi:unnamed protein product [Rotaria magnacalcarata]|uniref:Tc1-like transposase DDE domain-containing protein n=1 Tax=Rotaria magnacalcarata TaxID=392030 RepID=A0A817AU46_9BILA|nr:unnamed protein product [Rotaria magnacalcarata]CAF5206454.1 unnamed protein product [Rotaria magnacalcarata]
MFSDEKIFTRNGNFNPKNDVIWTDSRYDANEAGGYHETEKFPVSSMVALEEGDRLFGLKIWGFQQDGTNCHTGGKAQSWCRKHFDFFIPKEKWPPNSPELNPLDYSIWNEISRHIDYKKV